MQLIYKINDKMALAMQKCYTNALYVAHFTINALKIVIERHRQQNIHMKRIFPSALYDHTLIIL